MPDDTTVVPPENSQLHETPVASEALTPGAEIVSEAPVQNTEGAVVQDELAAQPMPVNSEIVQVNAPSVSAPMQPATASLARTIPAHIWRLEDRTTSLDTRHKHREEKLERLIAWAQKRKGSFSNNDVQLLLTIADATATNYCKILVERGILVETGETSGTRYTLKK